MGKKHPLLSRQDELDKKREHIGEILQKERLMKAAAEERAQQKAALTKQQIELREQEKKRKA